MYVSSAFSVRATTCVRIVAVLALAAGIGVWGVLLLAPAPGRPPPGLTTSAQVRGDTAPLAQWFGAQAPALRVTVVGLIASGERGAALLRVEGGAPAAFRVGQVIGQGVTLVRVEGDGVVLDNAGAHIRVAAAQPQPLASAGFVRVPAGDDSKGAASSVK